MSAEPVPPTLEDAFTGLLVACEEALAAGDLASTVSRAAAAPAGLQPRLQRGLACLRLLHELLSGSKPPAPPDPAGVAYPAEPAGARVGRFELRRRLGQGSFGVVWLAYDPLLRREVALKMPRLDALHDPRLRQRFVREAQAAAGLDHPNVVPVHEAGEAGPVCYIASAYCPGPTLARWLQERDQAVSAREAAALAAALADAVEHAHRNGVVHRDLKPGNVLLVPRDGADADGLAFTPRVTDFGLAKLLAGGSGSAATVYQTQSGAIVGTPCYMAPEQAGGKTAETGPAADVWALGAILYELLTGRPPFKAASVFDTLVQVANHEPAPPRQLQPAVPRDLETVCLKCLHKEAARRYASAEALADDLRRFLRREPVRARPVGPLARLTRWCRRNPPLAAALGLVAALLVTVAVVSATDAYRVREAQDATLKQLRRAEESEDKATRRLFRSLVNQARASRFSRRVGQRFDSLKALEEAVRIGRELNLPAEDFLELRNEAVACLALPDLRVAREWDGWPEGSAHLDFDGALARYVRTDQRGAVSVRRVDDDEKLWDFPSGFGNAWPRLSPDGLFLALADPPRLELRRLEGPQPVVLLREEDCTAHDFSPDGRWFAVVHADGAISLYDLASGGRVRRLNPGPHPVRFAAFHPDNRRLAVSHGGGVQVRDLDTGDVQADLPQAGAEHLAWHPDGNTLAVVGNDHVIHRWDVATGRQVPGLWRWKNSGLRITFNGAGDLLASFGREEMLRVWEPRTGVELFHMPAHFAGASLRFRADDRLLAAGITDNKLCLWEITAGPECRRLVHNPARGEAPYGPFTVSPDGRALAARTPDGFGLWDLGTGKPLASVPLGPLDVVLFEPKKSGALLTAGPGGVFRWAFQPDPAGAGGMRLGPPQRLPLPGTSGTQTACSRDGPVLASTQRWGGLVLHPDHPDQPVRLEPHEDAQAVAVSPDGRWVATGSANGTGARVWDARTGKPEKDLLPQEGGVRVGFSPDGRWLATRGNGLRLWAVGSWQEGPSLGGITGAAFAFSPAENLLATETGYGAVRLVDPDTGREFARLEDPDQVRVTWICFSPDGRELLTAGGGNDAWIRVWDLRAIRRQLAEMGLDWDPNPCPPAAAGPRAPFQVTVDRGQLGEQPGPPSPPG